MSRKLSIIIVSWNVCKNLLECITSILQNAPSCSYEVILVDNDSKDDVVAVVRSTFPEVVVIENDENLGFATANNQGIKRSQGQYIFLLNPDTIVHKNSLDALIKFLERNDGVGACGPRLLNKDGTIQRSVRRFPSYQGALYRFTFLKYFKIFKNSYRSWLMRDFDHKSQRDVDQLMGAALLVKKSIIDKIGGFDENFFMYYEEIDLCYRIKHNGWRIVFLPQACITHLGGRSSQQIPVAKRIMMLRSLLKYFRKNHGIGITFIFNCVFKPGIILRETIDLIINVSTYFFSLILLNKKRSEKSGKKIKSSVLFLFRFSTLLLNI